MTASRELEIVEAWLGHQTDVAAAHALGVKTEDFFAWRGRRRWPPRHGASPDFVERVVAHSIALERRAQVERLAAHAVVARTRGGRKGAGFEIIERASGSNGQEGVRGGTKA